MPVDLGKTKDTCYIPDKGIKEHFFKTTGRLNPKRYAKRIILCWTIQACSYLFEESTSSGLLILLVAVLTLGALIADIMLGIRRLHDLGDSGWWILCTLIPVVNIYWWFKLLLQDGDKGPNKYGPDPLGDRCMGKS